MDSEENIIFPNSINRIIFIEKEEYILSYRHNKIENFLDGNLDLIDLGKFYLTSKSKLKQYSSDDKIIASKSINPNVLNNEKTLIKKIVNILEGRIEHNEIFKLEDSSELQGNKIFKISLNMRSGVSLNLFTTTLTENIIKSHDDVLLTCMRYFRNKNKISEMIKIDAKQTEIKHEQVLQKFHNINREVERDSNIFLLNVIIE
jgi:hypothetical protein